MKRKLILLCVAVGALVLFCGSWKWAATAAKATDAPTVAEVIPVNGTGPSITADVVSADGSGAAALPDHPIVTTVETADGQQYTAVVIATDATDAYPTTVVAINGSWGW